MGYDGKQAIHPNQVSVIYECFRPPEESIAFAKKIVEANKLNQLDGKGAFEVDGKMIDMPMVSLEKTFNVTFMVIDNFCRCYLTIFFFIILLIGSLGLYCITKSKYKIVR